MAEIVCRNINKKYGTLEVVPDFNLTVKDHEFIVFLGPSGCGKSTILRMIAGLEEINGGELLIGGHVVNDAEPRERGIAMVFQNYALYPHMTIRENIVFGLRRLKIAEAEIETRLASVVSVLGLEPVMARKPAELSGGQQQRVAIARAMIKTPDVFLFDEPLSNLDAKLRAQMRLEIARLHKGLKTTTVYVTHDQMEAMTLADRIVLLNAGNIEQVGTPEEIYTRPRTYFAAGFIGTPAMNFLHLKSRRDGEGWRLTGEACDLSISGKGFDLTDGGDVIFGLRPDEFSVATNSSAGNVLRGRADIVEFHGGQALVGFSVGESRVNAFVPVKQKPLEGDMVTFHVDEAAMHIFDAPSGRSLLIAAEN